MTRSDFELPLLPASPRRIPPFIGRDGEPLDRRRRLPLAHRGAGARPPSPLDADREFTRAALAAIWPRFTTKEWARVSGLTYAGACRQVREGVTAPYRALLLVEFRAALARTRAEHDRILVGLCGPLWKDVGDGVHWHRPALALALCLALAGCHLPPNAYMDAYSASQGYYAPSVAAPPARTVCYRVVNQLVCDTR